MKLLYALVALGALVTAAAIGALLMNRSAAPKSIWDKSPEQVRTLINNKIMAVEAETPEVFAVHDITLNGKDSRFPLRIYSPNDLKDNPVILMIHGGAWVAGSLDTHDNMARYLCRGAQAVVVSVGYTNSPEGKYPLPLEQCYDALLWTTAHGKKYGYDPRRLAVIGDSAGGNMATAVCLMARDRKGPQITLQVLINPAPDLTGKGTLERRNDAEDVTRWQALQYVTDPKEVYNPYVSPAVAPNLSGLPRAVVILAEKDELREDGQKYADRLIAAGVPTTIYTQLGIGHLAGNGARASALAQASLNVAVAALTSALSKPS